MNQETIEVTPARKPYVEPQLMVYGSLEMLTQNSGQKGSDGETGSEIL